MTRTKTYPLVDRILDGQLAALLTTWRDEGLTIDQITRKLEDDHDVIVSRSTVNRWIADGPEAVAS